MSLTRKVVMWISSSLWLSAAPGVNYKTRPETGRASRTWGSMMAVMPMKIMPAMCMGRIMVPVMMIRMMAIGGVMIPDHAAAEHQAQDNQGDIQT